MQFVLLQKRSGIKCNQIPLERFRTYTSDLPDRQAGKNAQGVVALKRDFKFSTLDEILSDAKKSTLPLMLNS